MALLKAEFTLREFEVTFEANYPQKKTQRGLKIVSNFLSKT